MSEPLFETSVLPLTVALGLRTNGKPDLTTVTSRKLEKGFGLLAMAQINPAIDEDFLLIRDKFIRSLNETQQKIFAKIESRPGLLLCFGKLETIGKKIVNDLLESAINSKFENAETVPNPFAEEPKKEEPKALDNPEVIATT